MAVGQIGISRSDFLKLTEDEFNAIYEKWLEAKEAQRHEAWEVARWQAFRYACPPKARGGFLSIKDFGKFPWEQQTGEHAPLKLKSNRARYESLKDKWHE